MLKPKRELPGSIHTQYRPEMRRMLRECSRVVLVDPDNVDLLARVLSLHDSRESGRQAWACMIRHKLVWVDGRRLEVRELAGDDPYRLDESRRAAILSRVERAIEKRK